MTEQESARQVIKSGRSICQQCFHRKVCKFTENQPCAECDQYVYADGVRPVVRGEWIPYKLGDMQCSVCGGVYGVCAGLLGDFNLCPNCGADMRPNPPKADEI